MIFNSNSGSEWHKWDLHLHTPYTWLGEEYKNVTDDEFIDKIVSSNLSAVGITNYFKFSDEEMFSDSSLRKNLESRGVVVFPNLEFRLANQNAKEDLCDYHVIFSPELQNDKIKLFLHILDVHVGQDEKKASGLSEDELRGNSLYVDIKSINEAIIGAGISDYVMRGFLSRGKGESRSASVSDYILGKSDFIIHSSDIEENIQKDFDFWTTYIDEKNGPMPIFQGSDAHSLDKIGEQFTWIKGKVSFDGLLQTKYNPAERIRFQENNPAENKLPQTIIKSIRSDEKELVFNNDLNTFIGKRGGGKSILLKAIAQKASPSEYEERFRESSRVSKDSDWIKKIFGSDYVIEWADETLNSGDEDNKSILYLPQGYLSNLAYDEYDKVEERNNFITSLLMQYEKFRNAKEISGNHTNGIKNQIEERIGKIVELSERNKTLRKINSGIGESKGIESGVKVLDVKIKELSKKNNITEKDIELYQAASAESKNIQAELGIIEQDLEILEKISEAEDILIVRSDAFIGLSEKIKDELTEQILGNNKKSASEIISNEKKRLEKSKKDKKEKFEKYAKIVDELKPKLIAQKELRALTEKKINLKKNLEFLKKNDQQIRNNTEDGEKATNEIIDLYYSYKTLIEKAYSTAHLDFLQFSKIEFVVKFSGDTISKAIEQNINRNKTGGLSDGSKELLCDEVKEPSREHLREIIYDVLKNSFVFKASVSEDKKQFLSNLLNNPYSVNYLESIHAADGTDVTFDQMTGGQKAITMLELIFKLDSNNYPILIDQPEDDLDANGIATNIVDFIKNQKNERQIFIASHNANLVVCADSEEIIVADREDDFMYSSGAIEDEDIRNSIIDILEGGKEALELRMKKLKV